MNPAEVAIFLKTHPEFFAEYGDVLADIDIPHPHGDSAVSLAERQLAVLREKVAALEYKLGELIRFGEENDTIAGKVHRLCVALLGCHDLASTVRALYSHLGGAFAVPHVAVRLWGVGGEMHLGAPEFSKVEDTLKAYAGSIMNPYCGSSSGQEALAWFGERGSQIRSMAQIPLREQGQDGGACFGLLVLASEEVQRFYPDMGTLYLNRIGDIASAALLNAVN